MPAVMPGKGPLPLGSCAPRGLSECGWLPLASLPSGSLASPRVSGPWLLLRGSLARGCFFCAAERYGQVLVRQDMLKRRCSGRAARIV